MGKRLGRIQLSGTQGLGVHSEVVLQSLEGCGYSAFLTSQISIQTEKKYRQPFLQLPSLERVTLKPWTTVPSRSSLAAKQQSIASLSPQ